MAIQILENVALAPLTTMKVGGTARFLGEVKTIEDLKEAIEFARIKKLNIFVLGAGSNVVVPEHGFEGLVIKIEMEGLECKDDCIVSGAGENWDDIVKEAISKNLWGAENLSYIPSSVGGAAVQNIGAYGVEAKEIISSVTAFNVSTMEIKIFSNDECKFGYRESVFKKNKNYIVISVSFRLDRERAPRLEYEDVKKYFETNKNTNPTLEEIREAIVAIRIAKMPPQSMGTAGSFFKNPVVAVSQYETLKEQFPEIKSYLQGDNTVKLSAAWLLDHVGGWRGYSRGDAGVHEKQSLILVNKGNATAKEILSLALDMKNNIKEKTGITLEEEVVLM